MTELASLKELERCAEAACQAAIAVEPRINGAINFADLHCVEAGHCRTSDGGEYFYVLIEECDPSQRELYTFISQQLADAGWQQIDVRFAW